MSEATISAIIDNALMTANSQTSLMNAWCNGSWMTITPTPDTHSPQQFTGTVATADLASIFDAVNGVEKLPELQFPSSITIPNWKNPNGTAEEEGIYDIIKGLSSNTMSYSIDVIGPQLQVLLTNFITSYFPGFPPPELGLSDIENILSNRGYLVPNTMEDAAFTRLQDRLIADGRRVEQEALAEWSGRGFVIPPGEALYTSYMAKQNTQDKIAAAASDFTVKQIEIASELYKHGLTMAGDYRKMAINAAIDYIKQFTGVLMEQSGPQAYASILNARTHLYDTSIDLYKTMMGIRDLRARLSTTDRALDADYWKNYESMRVEIARQNSNAAIGAATAAGHAAAASLSSINAMASLANVSSS